MRVLVVADENFATREHAMLSRLEVGLAAEGIRIVHALPPSAAKAHPPEVFSQSVTYAEGRSLSRHWRAKWLKKSLDGLAEGEGPGAGAVDIVHCFGEGAWDIGAEVAAQTGAGLVLEVWAASLAPRALRVAAEAEQGSVLALAPDAAIAKLMQAEGGRDEASPLAVRITPWGVHTPGPAPSVFESGRAPSIVLVASGRDGAAIGRSLDGLAPVMARHPDLMVFAEAEAIERCGAWKQVKKLGMADRLTLAPDLESRRELALRGDVLMLPEALGEHRTLTLDAMASGMVVIAASDPLVAVLQDGHTARLVEGAKAERWSDLLGWALGEPDAARRLGLEARDFVKKHCRASSQVSAVADAYESLRSGESIPFQPGP